MTLLFGTLCFFAFCFLVGWPLSHLLPHRDPDPWLTPVIGFGAMTLAIAGLYGAGVPVDAAAVLVLVLAAAALVLLRSLHRLRPLRPGRWGALVMLVLVGLTAAPGLTGGDQFRVFQTPDSHRVMAPEGDVPLDSSAVFGARSKAEEYPAVGLTFAALASLLHRPEAEIAYAYGAALQALLGFAMVFFLSAFTRSKHRAAAAGAAFALGFFGQLALDLAAWSQLAGLSLGLAALGLVLRYGLRPAVLVGLCGAALFVVSPEGLAVFGLEVLPILWWRGRAAGRAFRGQMVRAVATALVLAAPGLVGSAVTLVRQTGVGAAEAAGWSGAFSGFLMGQASSAFAPLPDHVSTPDLLVGFAHAGVSVVAGLMGLYPLTAPGSLETLGLAGFVALLIVSTFGSGAARAGLVTRALAMSGVLGLLLFGLGHLAMAGTVWLMASPLLFAVLVRPWVGSATVQLRALPALLYLGIALYSGVWRPVAALSPDGWAHSPLYPLRSEAKADADPLVWLGRTGAVADFLNGKTRELDFVALPEPLVGFHAAETYQGSPLRWTDGQAALIVPAAVGDRPLSLDIALWPVRLPQTPLTIRIDGVTRFEGLLPDGAWQAHYDLPRSGRAVRIEILSPSFQPTGDPRRLGVAIARLVVSRP